MYAIVAKFLLLFPCRLCGHSSGPLASAEVGSVLSSLLQDVGAADLALLGQLLLLTIQEEEGAYWEEQTVRQHLEGLLHTGGDTRDSLG